MKNINYGSIVNPDKPGEIINGVRLKFVESKIFIEIPKVFTSHSFDILIGSFNNYGNVTLIKCMLHNSNTTSDCIDGVSKYEVSFLFTGISFNTISDIKFSKAFIEIPTLGDFYSDSMIKQTLLNNGKTITVNEPEEIELSSFNDFSLSISTGFRTQRKVNSIKVDETYKLSIKFKKGNVSFYEYLTINERFQSFMMLILNYSPDIMNITFYNDDYIINNGIKNTAVPIKCFTDFKNVDHKNILNFNKIKYPSIKNELGNMLNHWYNNTDLHISIDLLTEKIYNKGLSRENYFLNSCFSIEIFHRRFHNCYEYPEETYNEKLDNLCKDSEDVDFIKLIKGRLQFANEYSFRKRLKFFKDDFIKVLPKSLTVNNFIDKVVNTRNYLVHRSSEKNVFEGIDLYYASKYIESVLRINFLKTIECPDSIINESYAYVRVNLPKFYNLNKQLQTKLV